MATVNPYFQSGRSIGVSSEQTLYEDLIIESMKIYGWEVYYMPRSVSNPDLILTEDPSNKYEHAFPIEMYLEEVAGFAGDDELITKFGLEIRNTANFVVSRRRWKDVIGDTNTSVLNFRPTEGDIIYFPKTQSFFEIRKVDSQTPFFQVGKLFIYRMSCELMQFSNEKINTGIAEIDNFAASFGVTLDDYELLQESGEGLLLETYDISPILNESPVINNDTAGADNDTFTAEVNNVLDFSERNPFGEAFR
jgi:hypothetical protein